MRVGGGRGQGRGSRLLGAGVEQPLVGGGAVEQSLVAGCLCVARGGGGRRPASAAAVAGEAVVARLIAGAQRSQRPVTQKAGQRYAERSQAAPAHAHAWVGARARLVSAPLVAVVALIVLGAVVENALDTTQATGVVHQRLW